jgi:anaerobic ribonucleoside-triphosphate reductase activating protein
MIKYIESKVVFEEIPDEITLAINITNCPCHCEGCHSKYLWADIGKKLDNKEIDVLIKKNKGITAICFMGGDKEPDEINSLAKYVKENHKALKTGWYSGKEEISEEIKEENFDYIKIGPYIEEKGPLNNKNTNQRMYHKGIDITDRFWRKKE